MAHVKFALLLSLLVGSTAAAQPQARSSQPRRIDLSWGATEGASGYSVMRRTPNAAEWSRIAKLGPDVLRHSDRTVAPRETYLYRVDPVGAQGTPASAVEALDDFYLQLREAKAGVARLFVHRWDADFQEWMRSDLIEVKVGEGIGQSGMITDFRTGATLNQAAPDPKKASVERIRYTTKDGRKISVTTTQTLPSAVHVRKVKKPGKRPAKRDKTSTASGPDRPTGGGATARALAFPEPTRVGSAKGTKVVWKITNSSSFRMNVLIMNHKGARRLFKLGPDKEYVARFKSGGTYKVSANADGGKKIRPLEGSFGLASGSTYASNLKIEYREKGKK
jgi:hypothetical protein